MKGIRIPGVSTFRRGFINSQQPVVMGKALGMASSPSVHSNFFGLVLEATDPSKAVDTSPSLAGTSNTVQAEVVYTPRNVKGKLDIQNLDCSINYDAKGASNRQGKGKSQAV
jgi:hypothetical protein